MPTISTIGVKNVGGLRHPLVLPLTDYGKKDSSSVENFDKPKL